MHGNFFVKKSHSKIKLGFVTLQNENNILVLSIYTKLFIKVGLVHKFQTSFGDLKNIYQKGWTLSVVLTPWNVSKGIL